MCGIAGWLGERLQGEGYAMQMVQALHHRGPDASGIRSWPEATLVHTRLSIIDLSPTGAQPMANEDGTIWTVFNGEIYNHRELRHDLELRGHLFRGKSDTEVLPHLYEEHGAEFVSRLRGMFALAIYDTRARRLILARDRFGIKPLFYSPGRERLAFASEINALLELPGIDNRPDKQAIYDFAALFYIPAPETFYKGIRALQPGELIEARLDADEVSWKTWTYHRWSITPDPGMTLTEATDRAETLLTTAVRRQMESDVPIGSLLSGGIDSSLVSVAAQEVLHGGLQTFNVRFAEKEYDETWAAVAVARHIGSDHETLEMNGVRGNWDNVTDLLLHAGQLFSDTSLFAANGRALWGWRR
ncbi:MAG: asparagine synthase (glutamine-hydrolyzing) [Verrucomicrobia bacterium]|nr:MAG: asparagine synthase (glutamine-hydrolyzing) [Verrucomicrobiota bacterium]